MPVRSIQQDRHTAGGDTVLNAYRPGQSNRNIGLPFVVREADGLTRLWPIVAIGDKMVSGNGSAEQFDRRMLIPFRQFTQACSVGRSRQGTTLRQVGSLLKPPPERHPASIQPVVYFWHRVGAV